MKPPGHIRFTNPLPAKNNLHMLAPGDTRNGLYAVFSSLP